MAEKNDHLLNVTEAEVSSTDCLVGNDENLAELATVDPTEAVSELEAAWEDEYELSLRRIVCPKRDRHGEFIPIRQFNIDHLDAPYKDQRIVSLVETMAALTVRLQVRKLSVIRPQPPYPPDPRVKANGAPCFINGTGFVDKAFVFTEESGKLCPCKDCKKSACPSTRWGQVDIKTAGHVIHDRNEAEETICYFDVEDDDTDLASVPSLIGSADAMAMCTLRDDQFRVIFYTHDVDFAEKLHKLASQFYEQKQVLVRKYYGKSETPVPDVNVYNNFIDSKGSQEKMTDAGSLQQTLDLLGSMLKKRMHENFPTTLNNIQTDSNLVIVVSHPHGCGKYVSLGKVHSRKTIKDNSNIAGVVLDWLTCSFYVYTTHTCPGSSGAPVFILSKDRFDKTNAQIHSAFLRKSGLSRSGFSIDL